MLKIIGFGVNVFLILIILVRIPDRNRGLSSFANKSNLLGSPGSAQRFLNTVTGIGILIYFIVAFQLNLEH